MKKTSYLFALLLVISVSLPAFANDLVTMNIQKVGNGSYILTAKRDEIYGVQSLDVEVDYDPSKLEYPLVQPINGGELMDIRADSPGKLYLNINRDIAHNFLQINLDFTPKWDAPDGIVNVYAMVLSRTDTPIQTDSDAAAFSEGNGNGPHDMAGTSNSGIKAHENSPAMSGSMPSQFAPTDGDRRGAVGAAAAPSTGSALLARYAGKALAGEMGFLIRDEKSVLERFKKFKGEKSLESFVALFGRTDPMTEQNPIVALSDGKTPVTIKIGIRPDGSRNGGIALVGATLVSKETNEKGIVITVLPSKGTCNASLVLVSGEDIVGYHVAVAPPVDIGGFNENNFMEALQTYMSSQSPELQGMDKRYISEYIFTANYLVSLDKRLH